MRAWLFAIRRRPSAQNWVCISKLSADTARSRPIVSRVLSVIRGDSFRTAWVYSERYILVAAKEDAPAVFERVRYESPKNLLIVMCVDGIESYPSRIAYIRETALSTARFLAVKYSHPKMSVSIFIDLPRSIYRIGNSVLGPAFVARWMEHTVGDGNYMMDEDYVIEILDSSIRKCTLACGDHCVITATGYNVIRK